LYYIDITNNNRKAREAAINALIKKNNNKPIWPKKEQKKPELRLAKM